jgi:hypothetical protein
MSRNGAELSEVQTRNLQMLQFSATVLNLPDNKEKRAAAIPPAAVTEAAEEPGIRKHGEGDQNADAAPCTTGFHRPRFAPSSPLAGSALLERAPDLQAA